MFVSYCFATIVNIIEDLLLSISYYMLIPALEEKINAR